MAKSNDKNNFESEDAKLHKSLPLSQDAADVPKTLARYLRLIDIAKKVVAIVMVFCGLAFIIAAHRADYVRDALGRDPKAWIWLVYVFGIGIIACLVATLMFILEYLARPAAPTAFSIKPFIIRFFLILVAAVAIYFVMLDGYGKMQGIGAIASLFLALAAVREHGITRTVLGTLATIAIGLTVYGTQTTYQYARHHAEEIVAAGNQLGERCPSTPKGQEISIDDSRIPKVLRKLGAQRIWIDNERVAVYVGGETEFQICLLDSLGYPNPVWGFRGKGATQISDRLWTNDY